MSASLENLRYKNLKRILEVMKSENIRYELEDLETTVGLIDYEAAKLYHMAINYSVDHGNVVVEATADGRVFNTDACKERLKAIDNAINRKRPENRFFYFFLCELRDNLDSLDDDQKISARIFTDYCFDKYKSVADITSYKAIWNGFKNRLIKADTRPIPPTSPSSDLVVDPEVSAKCADDFFKNVVSVKIPEGVEGWVAESFSPIQTRTVSSSPYSAKAEVASTSATESRSTGGK